MDIVAHTQTHSKYLKHSSFWSEAEIKKNRQERDTCAAKITFQVYLPFNGR
jgi:hypothetical protein